MHPDRFFISFLPFDLSMNIYILFLYKFLLNSLYIAVINGKDTWAPLLIVVSTVSTRRTERRKRSVHAST